MSIFGKYIVRCASLGASLFVGVAHADILYGVGIHSLASTPDHQADLRAITGMHLDSARSDAQWASVEKTKGVYSIPSSWDDFVNSYVAAGVSPVLILDYGNPLYGPSVKPNTPEAIQAYANYAKAVASHFKGKVKIYEIWNEWDNNTGGGGPGSPEDYAKLFFPAYAAIKQADPSATVLSSAGVRKGWYENLAKLGVLDKADGVSIHPYTYKGPPEISPELYAEYMLQTHSSLLSLIKRKELNFYVTEIGWPTHEGKWSYSEEASAASLARTLILSAGLPFVKGVWLYDLKNDGQNKSYNEDNFGLLNFDRSPKVAYNVLSALVPQLKGRQISPVKLGISRVSVVSVTADRPGQTPVTFAWTPRPKDAATGRDCRQITGVKGKGATDSSVTVSPTPSMLGASCSQMEFGNGH